MKMGESIAAQRFSAKKSFYNMEPAQAFLRCWPRSAALGSRPIFLEGRFDGSIFFVNESHKSTGFDKKPVNFIF